jgi:hypothetical protein
MTINNYAFVKNNEIVNVALFDDPSQLLLDEFKTLHDADYLIKINNESIGIGGTFDGTNLWAMKPKPSWIKDQETLTWIPPVPYPAVEEGSNDVYSWDEETVSWILDAPLY